jgi:hypothetical protein
MSLTTILRCILFAITISWLVPTHAQVSLGLRTQMWPQMWSEGMDPAKKAKLNKVAQAQWEVSEANLHRYAELGGNWNVVIARQRIDEPETFERLKNIIQVHRSLGIEVVLRIIEKPEVYQEFSSDFGAKGYHSEYYDWVSRLTAAFADDVQYYLVSNEVDHNIDANLLKRGKPNFISYDDYDRLLKTAAKAIRANDPDANVADHGVSSYSLGLAISDYIRKEQGILKAYEYWKTYKNDGIWQNDPLIFDRFLANPDTQRRISIVNRTIAEAREADHFQFHLYHNEAVLPEVLDWLNARMAEANNVKPLIATEIGHRIPHTTGTSWDGRKENIADMSGYSQRNHAEVLVKKFATLAGHDVSYIMYWAMRMHHHRTPSASLFLGDLDAKNFTQTEQATAYQYLAATINGRMVTGSTLTEEGILSYQFRDPTKNNPDFSVAWSRSGEQRIPSSRLRKLRSVRDIDGSTISYESETDLMLSERPVYLFWHGDKK